MQSQKFRRKQVMSQISHVVKKKEIGPQLSPLTKEEEQEFLKQPHVAIVASHNPDDTIHQAGVWYKFNPETNEILFGTQDASKKIRNIKENNKVSIQISTHQMPYKGVYIYGTASLDYEDVINKRIEIFSNYTSPEMARGFVEYHAQKHKPVVVRIKIDKFQSFDYAK